MAKQRRTRVRPMQEPTRELTMKEKEERQVDVWFLRLSRVRRTEIRLWAATGNVRLADAKLHHYREEMKDAGRPG